MTTLDATLPTELFQIGAHGDATRSRIRLDVAIHCTSPLAHLAECAMKKKPQPPQEDEVAPQAASVATGGEAIPEASISLPATCSTGLRVYDGAMVLAEFFASQVFARSRLFQQLLSTPPETSTTTTNKANTFVGLELGCGCGLAGLTLWHVLEEARRSSDTDHTRRFPSSLVVLTDASQPCLEYVHLNYNALAASSKKQVSSSTTDDTVDARAPVVDIRVLDWEDSDDFFGGRQDAGRFWANNDEADDSAGTARRRGGADIVFGSDLVYFNASPFTLFSVAERMMRYDGENVATSTRFPPILVLCHHCRIPDGVRVLRRAAGQAGLVLFTLPLSLFLPASEILPRCRGGMQFLIACRVHDAQQVQDTLLTGVDGSPILLAPFELDVGSDDAAAMMQLGSLDDDDDHDLIDH